MMLPVVVKRALNSGQLQLGAQIRHRCRQIGDERMARAKCHFYWLRPRREPSD